MRACALLIIAGSTDHAGHTKEEMDYVLRRATNRLLILACLPACQLSLGLDSLGQLYRSIILYYYVRGWRPGQMHMHVYTYS